MTTGGETVKVRIDEVVYRGAGMGRIDGKVCFVRGVAAGEVVRARVSRVHARYTEAELMEVLEPSPDRIRPECPIARGAAVQGGVPCAGCAYQHITYAAELRAKQSQFASMLTHNAGIPRDAVGTPFASPQPTGYRNKIVLHVAMTQGRKALGYFGEDNETVVDVPRCLLAMDPINELLARTRAAGGFLDDVAPGGRMTFRYTRKDGPLCWGGKAASTDELLTESGVVGDVMAPRDGFYQVNGPVADELVRNVREMVRDSGCGCVLDLFCGVGVFSLAAAQAGAGKVRGADTDRRAIQVARMNAARLGLRNVEFAAATAAETMRRAASGRGGESQAVIVDPPRAGMDAELLDALCAAAPRDVIYVSCAADTMVRDAVVLLKAGYTAVSARLLDMFPRTQFFESVTHFRKTGDSCCATGQLNKALAAPDSN